MHQSSCPLLRQLEISTWRFKTEPEGTMNLGPMAQDFHRLFGMGTETTIDVSDLAALALVAAQELARSRRNRRAQARQRAELKRQDAVTRQRVRPRPRCRSDLLHRSHARRKRSVVGEAGPRLGRAGVSRPGPPDRSRGDMSSRRVITIALVMGTIGALVGQSTARAGLYGRRAQQLLRDAGRADDPGQRGRRQLASSGARPATSNTDGDAELVLRAKRRANTTTGLDQLVLRGKRGVDEHCGRRQRVLRAPEQESPTPLRGTRSSDRSAGA